MYFVFILQKPGMSLNDVNMLKPVSPSVNRQRNRVRIEKLSDDENYFLPHRT